MRFGKILGFTGEPVRCGQTMVLLPYAISKFFCHQVRVYQTVHISN